MCFEAPFFGLNVEMQIYINEIRNLAISHAGTLKFLAFGSLGFFILTPVIAPAAIILMPTDTLVRERNDFQRLTAGGKTLRLMVHILKNALGSGLIILGILLLFMPGQGLLTIFIGLLLTDFPGRRTLLAYLLGSGRIRPIVDKLRIRYHQEPMLWPCNDSDTDTDSAGN